MLQIARTIIFVVGLLSVFCALESSGANISWDDGGFLSKDWSHPGNWDTGLPGTIPTAGDDVFIGNLPAALGDMTIIDQDFTIDSLSLTNGADADTAGNVLTVAGDITVGGAGSTFTASEHNGGPNTVSVSVHDITVSTGGAYMIEGITEIDEPGAAVGTIAINSNSLFSGYGALLFREDFGGTQTVQLVNNGTFQTRRPSGASNTERFDLDLTSTPGGPNGGSRLDLDGITENGIVDIGLMTTLDLNIRMEEFNGTMEFAPGAHLEYFSGFFAGQDAIINVNAETALAGVPSTALFTNSATLKSNAQLNVNSGTAEFGRRLEAEPTATIFLGTGTGIHFKESTLSSVIDGDLILSGSGIEMTVDSFVEINDPSFDWDGPEDATMTIRSTGVLIINSGDIEPAGDDAFNGTIHVNGNGNLRPNIPGGWNFAGTMNINAPSAAPSVVSTETMTVDGGDLVATGAFAVLDVPVIFTGNASGGTTVPSGSTMRFIENTFFQGGSTHSGDGILEFSGNMTTITGNHTISMPGGTVNLDGSTTDAETLTLQADLTVDANSLGASNTFGDSSNAATDTIVLQNSSATLTINLTNPTDHWTLGEKGLINITGGGTPTVSLAGSDLNIQGEISITDSTQFTARIDLGKTGMISVNTAGKELRFSGGNASNPNTIDGGTIQGAGEITANGAAVLEGHGTIDTNVRFLAGSDLLADNGTLTVNGNILDADTIGTADADGTLELGTTLDTANVNTLQLNGGIVTGQSITNNGTTQGNGTITTAGFLNNGTLSATGGTLILNTTSAPDIDGAGINGVIEAISNSLRIVKTPTDAFGGDATVAGLRTLSFDNNWTLGTNGTLNLNGGGSSILAARLSAGGKSNLDGTIHVTNFGLVSGDADLGSTLTVNLPSGNEVLEFNDGTTRIAAGTTFTGFGTLINGDNGDMTIVDDFDSTSLLLQNDGDLHLGTSPGQVEMAQFEQTATGTLFIELAGTNPNDFDSLTADFNATLAGKLDVTLLGGFTPTLGDTFTIVTGAAGRFGVFTTEILPALTGNNIFAVNYTSNSVVLEVVASSLPGDFDLDGDVDGQDFLVWQRNPSVGNLADWQANYGLPLTAVATAVPEPGAPVLLLCCLLFWKSRSITSAS